MLEMKILTIVNCLVSVLGKLDRFFEGNSSEDSSPWRRSVLKGRHCKCNKRLGCELGALLNSSFRANPTPIFPTHLPIIGRMQAMHKCGPSPTTAYDSWNMHGRQDKLDNRGTSVAVGAAQKTLVMHILIPYNAMNR